MDALARVGVIVQILVVVICAVRVARFQQSGRTSSGSEWAVHGIAVVLLIACVLPVPALLAADASALTWGLWGAGYLAAAVIHAIADTLRDIPGNPSARSKAVRSGD